MILPSTAEKLTPWSRNIIERCRSSQGSRAGLARSQKQWLYTGSPDGNAAIYNKLYPHIDRLASSLYSPNDLRFHMDFTHSYPKQILQQAEVASRVLTRTFEQRDIDIQWGQGVQIALTFGAAVPKLLDTHGGMTAKICMPWQIGVYREDREGFADQEAVCETNFITPFELWRRISHLPDAIQLYRRALSYAKRTTAGDDSDTYFHQLLLGGSPPAVQTDPPFMMQPGGLVQVMADSIGAQVAPDVVEELITIHELWVVDDERQDWTTIQICEPDILIAPRYRRTNLFIPEVLPYGLIQPNHMPNYFWGRSEMADLMKLQHMLRDRLEDKKKLMSLEYDRLLAFSGMTGMTDELYDQQKQAGFFNLEQGAKVDDLTPKLPEAAFADIQEILKFMDEVSGFGNILSGQGEPGVRAGNHAETLLKTASPRLRDRALLVERQVADFADKAFQLLAAKEAKAYWTPDGGPETEFMLSQLPDDYRITVDSHSSSPIYQDDHKDIAAFLYKAGAIGADSLLELLPVPMRDILLEKYKDIQRAKAEQLKEVEQHPELLKVIKGGKR